jgi:hypothetical protein
MTEDEKKVIDILVSYPKTTNPRGEPFHAVDRAMTWATKETETFVDGLQERKLIRMKSSAFARADLGAKLPTSDWWWERVETIK